MYCNRDNGDVGTHSRFLCVESASLCPYLVTDTLSCPSKRLFVFYLDAFYISRSSTIYVVDAERTTSANVYSKFYRSRNRSLLPAFAGLIPSWTSNSQRCILCMRRWRSFSRSCCWDAPTLPPLVPTRSMTNTDSIIRQRSARSASSDGKIVKRKWCVTLEYPFSGIECLRWRYSKDYLTLLRPES